MDWYLIEKSEFRGEYRSPATERLGIILGKESAIKFLNEYTLKHDIGSPNPTLSEYKKDTYVVGNLYGTRVTAEKLTVLDVTKI